MRRVVAPSRRAVRATPAQFSSTIDGTGADGARSELAGDVRVRVPAAADAAAERHAAAHDRVRRLRGVPEDLEGPMQDRRRT